MATYWNGSCVSYWAPGLPIQSTKCNLNPRMRQGLLSIYFLGLDLNLKENSQSFPYLTLLIWFSWTSVVYYSLPYAMPIIPPSNLIFLVLYSCKVTLWMDNIDSALSFIHVVRKEGAELWRRVIKLRWMGPEGWVDCVRDDGDGRATRSAVHERRGAVREIRLVLIWDRGRCTIR